MAEIDLDLLQLPNLGTFSVAAETCSFTLTARKMKLTQAAVSQRIQALEQAVGKALFQRRGGRVHLTDAGRQLYDYAQRILELHREARREVGGRETPLRGELLLAASSVPGEHLLPALLAGFRRKHPLIQIRATVSDSDAVMAQVSRGEVSIGLVGLKTDSPHLEFRHLADDRMLVVVPPGHPLTRRRRVELIHLAKYPLILREPGSGLRHGFEKAVERAGTPMSTFRIALELGSNEAIKAAVLRGMGVAVLSAFAVRKELDVNSLMAVRIVGLRTEREIFVVLNPKRVLPIPARSFLAYLETNPLPAL